MFSVVMIAAVGINSTFQLIGSDEVLLMKTGVMLITGHQGFFTEDALSSIAQTTLQNISLYEETGKCQNEVTMGLLR